jgi:hypothetical protein
MTIPHGAVALAIAAALAMLLPTDSAHAQRNRRASPNSYGATNSSVPSPGRTAEDQRIIDAISRNAWSAGY